MTLNPSRREAFIILQPPGRRRHGRYGCDSERREQPISVTAATHVILAVGGSGVVARLSCYGQAGAVVMVHALWVSGGRGENLGLLWQEVGPSGLLDQECLGTRRAVQVRSLAGKHS